MPTGSFDRAASEYDAARGFPPDISDQVAGAALAWLPRGAELAVLDVGVGTGRIARPLMARGVRCVGVDLSAQMMARLVATLPPGLGPPELVRGAAEALPFSAASFDAALSVHVFHLLVDWRAALDEVRRVLRLGGVFLIGFEHRPPDSPSTRLMERWRAIVRARSPQSAVAAGGAGTTDFADIRAALLAGGAQVDEQVVGDWTVTRTLARLLEAIEHRTWSADWPVPPGFFAACLDELRGWAQAKYGPLEREFQVPHRFVWQRFGWPASGI